MLENPYEAPQAYPERPEVPSETITFSECLQAAAVIVFLAWFWFGLTFGLLWYFDIR